MNQKHCRGCPHLAFNEMSDEMYCKLKEAFEDEINAEPTIEPERKKGAWINEGRIIRCSKCKIGYATVKGMKSALTYNFCPNCGADMRGNQNENG